MANSRRKLSVTVNESKAGGTNYKEDSFDVTGEVFIRGDIAINKTGVHMRDRAKAFMVNFEELELGEVIGRGCSSYVQRGLHIPTQTHLALKVINLFDKGKRDQLIKEIRLLYDAMCPSIITFYGAFYREGSITIALEFMDGGSLANVVAELRALPEAVLANITFQILWGLAYLKHEKRVHRDLKPSNILINSQGLTKLSDFGVAASLQSSIAMCGTFVGTFKYMSPERIMNKKYSYPSDIWSLGIVLLECATGRYPYATGRAMSYIDLVQTVLESPAPAPPADGTFSPEFTNFIGQCLQKDPAARLPADVLLGSPWLKMHGAESIDAAVQFVAKWIRSLQ